MIENNIPNKKVVVGGTFDVFHRGHEKLLRRAFDLGVVMVGLTSDLMAGKTRDRTIKEFEKRKKVLQGFIEETLGKEAEIVKIEDRFFIS